MTNYGEHAMSSPQLEPMNPAKDLATLLGYHGVEFVRCAYLTLVKREPDETGMDFYFGRLLEGTSKLQILTEMHRSSEAKEKGAKLPGLERAIFLRTLASRPLIGPVLRPLLRVEGDSVTQVRLRRIEQYLIALYRVSESGRPRHSALAGMRCCRAES